MSQKIDFGNGKLALAKVEGQAGSSEVAKDLPQVVLVLLSAAAGYQNIVYVYKDEIQAFKNLVHKPPESHSGVFQADGICRNYHNPKGAMTAVFGTADSSRGICRYPFFRSSLLKIEQPSRWLEKSAKLGTGYLLAAVAKFSQQKSPQGRHPPSFFLTKCNGLLHWLAER